MICENCKKNFATVHVSSWQTIAQHVGNQQDRKPFEHHYCESCASDLKQSNSLLNPFLRAGPSAKAMKVRVVKVSDTAVEIELIKEKSDACQDRYLFSRRMFPQEYAIEGMKFEMLVTEDELKMMQENS